MASFPLRIGAFFLPCSKRKQNATYFLAQNIEKQVLNTGFGIAMRL